MTTNASLTPPAAAARSSRSVAASPPIVARADARRVRWNHVVHAVVIAAGWTLLAVFWVRAVRNTDTAAVWTMLQMVGTALALIVSVTLVWVAHNVEINRRKGPRRAVPPVAESHTHDFVGRELRADWDRARTAGVVVVTVDGGTKRYDPWDIPGPARKDHAPDLMLGHER